MERLITIITGTTSGIGKATARKLHMEGHHLVLGNRNPEKSQMLKKELLAMDGNAPVDIYDLDLSSFDSIEKFAAEVKKNYQKIDILINNAGLLMHRNKVTDNGFEMTIGVNYLGTYLLTELLIEKLEKSSKPKIIFVSSIICKFGKCRIREKFFKNRRKGLIAYDNSKLALMMYAMELDERLSEKGFVIKAVHPGIVYTHIFKWGTAFGEWIGGVQKWFFKSPEQGAAMQIMIATTDKYDDGHLYYKAYKKLKLPKQIKDADFRKRFIEFTQNLVESSRK